MKITNSLKIGILLLGILTITTNCEKEKIIDNPIEESNNAGTQIEHISSKDAPQVINAITSITGKSSLKSTSYSKTLSYKKAHIDIDNILKVKNHKNITNYTFNIFVENSPINEFYNLIVNEGSDKKLKNPYVIKYVVDDDALDNFLANNSDFRYFKGKQYVLSFDSFFDSFDLSSKSTVDTCPTIETTVNNSASDVPGGLGGSGNFYDITDDNFMQTDPNSYSYGQPNAGDSYNLFFNSFSTSTQTSTSYEAIVLNNDFPISLASQPSAIIQISGMSSNSNGILPPRQFVSATPLSNGTGYSINIYKCYSDGHWTSEWIIIYKSVSVQQKQTVSERLPDSCPDPEGEIGVYTISAASEVIIDCLLKTNLTPDQFYFVIKDERSIKLGNYLYNNCIPESKEFAFPAIDAYLKKGEVDYVDRIIIDSTFLNSKANCVYVLLKQQNTLKNILAKLLPENSTYKLVLIVKNDLRDSKTNEKVNGKTTGNYLTDDYTPITIQIDKDFAATSSFPYLAIAIVHEAIHAKLFEMVKSVGGLNNLQEFTDETTEFGQLWAYYKKYGPEKGWHHELIYDNYIKTIAAAVEDFHKIFYPEDYIYFHDHMVGIVGYNKDSLYQDVAKYGLRNTTQFPKADSTRIALLAEYLRNSSKANYCKNP